MLVRFQMDLMMALSSSLACSKLPCRGKTRGTPLVWVRHSDDFMGCFLSSSSEMCTFCFDLEGGSDQSEQGGVEGDRSVTVQGHVHAD